jgi:hypothetical protein
MKEFQNLMELKDAPEEVFFEIQAIITTSLEEMAQMKMRDTPIAADPFIVNFEEFLGGKIYLVEELSDLKEVQSYDHHYCSVLEAAGSFDVAHYLPSQEFVFMSYITNDAGGNGYFIPSDIVSCVPNIESSIGLSHDGDSKKTMTFRGPIQEITRISPLSGRIQTQLIPITLEKYEQLISSDMMMGQFINITKNEIDFIRTGVTLEEKIIITPAD